MSSPSESEIYRETIDTWNRIAAIYKERFMDLDLYNGGYDLFLTQLPSIHSSVLEIGCGPGNITRYLLSRRPQLKVLGVDAAPGMITLAEKNNPNAAFSVMDCRAITQLPGGYDGIICGFCIPYLLPKDALQLLHDCYSLLKARGVLYFSFVEGDPINSGYQYGSSGLRSYFNFYTLEILLGELTKAGFRQVHVDKVAFAKTDGQESLHMIVIACKDSSIIS